MICNPIVSDINCNTILPYEEFEEGNVYVYIFLLNKSTGNTITQVFIREREDLDIEFTIGQDGYYTLCKIRLVTKNTLDLASTDEIIDINSLEPDKEKYNTLSYYYHDGSFYKGLQLVELADILRLKSDDYDLNLKNLDIEYFYYFLLCKLRKCYISAAKSILDKRASIKCNSGDISSEDIYKRDLLWSAINTIIYLTEMDQYEEAERLLERITSCNGLCNNGEIPSNCNCGCGD